MYQTSWPIQREKLGPIVPRCICRLAYAFPQRPTSLARVAGQRRSPGPVDHRRHDKVTGKLGNAAHLMLGSHAGHIPHQSRPPRRIMAGAVDPTPGRSGGRMLSHQSPPWRTVPHTVIRRGQRAPGRDLGPARIECPSRPTRRRRSQPGLPCLIACGRAKPFAQARVTRRRIPCGGATALGRSERRQ